MEEDQVDEVVEEDVLDEEEEEVLAPVIGVLPSRSGVVDRSRMVKDKVQEKEKEQEEMVVVVDEEWFASETPPETRVRGSTVNGEVEREEEGVEEMLARFRKVGSERVARNAELMAQLVEVKARAEAELHVEERLKASLVEAETELQRTQARVRELEARYVRVRAEQRDVEQRLQSLVAEHDRHKAASPRRAPRRRPPKPSRPSPSPKPRPRRTSKPSNPLFTHMFVVGAGYRDCRLGRPVDATSSSWVLPPLPLFEYPQPISAEAARAPLAREVASFCFPSGVKIKQLRLSESASDLNAVLFGHDQFKRGAHCHTFLLNKDDKGGRLYGVAVVVSRVEFMRDDRGVAVQVVAPYAVCMVSEYPLLSAHFDLIFALLSLQRVHRMSQPMRAFDSTPRLQEIGECMQLLEQYHNVVLPAPGTATSLTPPHEIAPVFIERPMVPGDEARHLLGRFMLPVALTCGGAVHSSSASFLVTLVELLLLEYSVVVVHPTLAICSAAVQSCMLLVGPLAWTGIVLPVLPDALLDLLEAPVPLIAGLATLPQDHIADANALGEHQVVWFPNKNQLWLPRQFKPAMPGRGQLGRQVSPLLKALAGDGSGSVFHPSPGQLSAAEQLLDLLNDYVAHLLRKSRAPDARSDRFYAQLRHSQMYSHFHE